MAFKISSDYYKKMASHLRANEGDTIFVLGIDESYANTGMSITYGNPFYGYKTVASVNLISDAAKDKNEYRTLLLDEICMLLDKHKDKSNGTIECITVVERIRQFSRGFISIDYIKSMGALIAYIIEASSQFVMPTFSVDTRCWKSTVVGNSKPMVNSFHVAPEKYPTLDYVVKHGMKGFVFNEVSEEEGKKLLSHKNPKNIFKSASGKYVHVDDDKADSICISRFIFEAMSQGKDLDKLLKLEQ